MKASSYQETHYNQAKASLQQALTWYSSFQRHGHYAPSEQLQGAVRGELQALKRALDKLDQTTFRIAAFGLVSRGKSAVLNGLVGEKLLETGPLHGVTKYPRSVAWTPVGGKIKVELIDTPGLDEIEGQARADMAKEVAREADLILFVVAGDITRTEYEALCELRQAQKPLMVVFNKVDLYPERDRALIYQQLQQLSTPNHSLSDFLSLNEIVMVAAEPAPIPLRVEWPNGEIQETLETPPPQVTELRERILTLLNQEGRSLLALNALIQAQDAEQRLARKTLELRATEAETLIWQYAKSKALIVALNPIALLDILGGLCADLALIRALARLYGLPMTSYQAGNLLRKILVSSGTLFLGELGSSFVLGVGKSASVVSHLWDSPAAFSTYATTAALQGGLAGYGSYVVGKAAQDYLEKGCSWGALGASTVIQEILGKIDPQTILYRLREELGG